LRRIGLAVVLALGLFLAPLAMEDHAAERNPIRPEVTKSGRRREVPLGSNADAALARCRDRFLLPAGPNPNGYVFGSLNWNTFRSAREAALAASTVEAVRFHDLRHTFASWLVQRGRTIKEVQAALGHQTIAMTMRYAHLAPDHLRAAVAVLDGVLPTVALREWRKDGARDQRLCGQELPAEKIETIASV